LKEERICKENPISSKDLVELYLKTILKKKKPIDYQIYEIWDLILPENLKKHIKIKEVKDDILILIADHPAWLQKANMSKNTILRKIKKEIPSTNIKSVHIICR